MSTSSFSLKLGDKLYSRLQAASKRTGRTMASIVREAVGVYLKQTEGVDAPWQLSESKPEGVYIYVLLDPATNAVRYVGQTINPPGRMANHRHRNGSNPRLMEWKKQLRPLYPEMYIVDYVPANERHRAEREWYEHLLALGCSLLNAIPPLPATP